MLKNKKPTSNSSFFCSDESEIEELVTSDSSCSVSILPKSSEEENQVFVSPIRNKEISIPRVDQSLGKQNFRKKEETTSKSNSPFVKQSLSFSKFLNLVQRHFSHLFLIVMVLLLGVGCFFFVLTFSYHQVQETSYSEESFIDYRVCPSQGTCYTSSNGYSSHNINQIPIVFRYSANYEKEISYQTSYSIDVVLQVMGSNLEKPIYQEKKEVVSPTIFQKKGKNLNFSTKTEFNFSDYQRQSVSLLAKYPEAIGIQVQIEFVLKEENHRRTIASLSIPFTEQVVLEKKVIEKKDKVLKQELSWSNYNTLFLVFSILLIGGSGFLFYFYRGKNKVHFYL